MSHRAAVLAVGVTLLAPASAQAAGKPIVKTGAAASVAQQTVSLTGSVTPNGAATTYFFQYGPTKIYGAQTPTTAVAKRGAVSAPVAGLAPNTTYHYRLVAHNRFGFKLGADRAFKTLRQPLALALGATPNPVSVNGATTLSGQLTGTGNANRAVVLQSNPFPFTQGFVSAANTQLTNAQGGFAFPVFPVSVNTQYRVYLADRPALVSPILSLGVSVHLRTHVSRHRLHRGGKVRFFGTVTPANDGSQFAIQRKSGATWVTIGGNITRHASGGKSKFSKRIRLRRSGTFRIYMGVADGSHVANSSRSIHIRVRR
jgi:hypothetical protein